MQTREKKRIQCTHKDLKRALRSWGSESFSVGITFSMIHWILKFRSFYKAHALHCITISGPNNESHDKGMWGQNIFMSWVFPSTKLIFSPPHMPNTLLNSVTLVQQWDYRCLGFSSSFTLQSLLYTVHVSNEHSCPNRRCRQSLFSSALLPNYKSIIISDVTHVQFISSQIWANLLSQIYF